MTTTSMPAQPFRIPMPDQGGMRRTLATVTQPALARVLALGQLNDIYNRIQSWVGDERHFADKVLDALNITVSVPESQLASIPRTGPIVVVANHPFGGLEGIVLTSLLKRVRPDVKVMANYMLSCIPDLRETFIFVDPFGKADSASRNVGSMRQAMRWLKDGGMLGVFPAGEVSHLTLRQRHVTDPVWSSTIARIIRHSDAAVVPMFFGGRNGNLFQLLGVIHPRLRSVMLPRELLKKRHSTVQVRVGQAIEPRRWQKLKDPDELTAYMRVRTYILKSQFPDQDDASTQAREADADDRPIAAAQPVRTLLDEIHQLPAEQVLATHNDLQVMYFRSKQAPHVLQELGRLREIAFRKVGEGTGKPSDLDTFDAYYLHLIVWDKVQQRIAGSYRMGPSDEILPKLGPAGLYTSTLFHFKPQLLSQITPALELGRSFVHPDYQKTYAPLMMLWRGIGLYVHRHPRYRNLFGPVSISTEYKSISRQLLVAFLTLNKYLPDLGKLIRPMNPPKHRPFYEWDSKHTSAAVRDVEDVNELISEIEADRKSMPVLLRQYLKLNGKLLGFNVDPDFGDVLDGLILIDLTQVDPNILYRYMGKANAQEFFAHHQ